jgi:hypothetical protein
LLAACGSHLAPTLQSLWFHVFLGNPREVTNQKIWKQEMVMMMMVMDFEEFNLLLCWFGFLFVCWGGGGGWFIYYYFNY